jgi:adenylate kinase
MKNITILGPQGSGKGTQAKILAKHYMIPHISTGDILREAIKEGTDLGMQAKELINAGTLVPDKIVNGIVKERVAKPDCAEGYILDGYPRNIDQAKALEHFSDLNFVIELTVPDELSVRRIVHRRQCKSCGAIFGIDFPPQVEGKCDKCGNELFQRADDTNEAVKKRLEIYHEETEPILEYYKPRDVVYEIDGTKKIEEVQRDIQNILG